MEPLPLTGDERAELERLRAQVASYQHRGNRAGRWVAAGALLIVAAILAGLAVVAVYLRAEVLDTESYVETVTPLAENIAIRHAVADRLTDEIIVHTGMENLAAEAADWLEEQGAPAGIGELVGPLVSGLRSFLSGELYDLLGTPQFQRIWLEVNRVAHDGLVAVLTGENGELITADDTTITVDLGAVLAAAKDQLVARGIGIAEQIPDLSVPYELADIPELPTLRRYVNALDSAATWLPFLALVVLVAGVAVAPDRRRGIITGGVAVGFVAVALLAALAVAREYYLGQLPPTVLPAAAAEAVVDIVLRFLVASLRAILVAALVVVVVALLAGPSRPARAIQRLVEAMLNAGARALSRTGRWVAPTGRAVAGARPVLQIVVVLGVVAGFIIAQRPGIAAVLWATVVILALFAILEIFGRASDAAVPGHRVQE